MHVYHTPLGRFSKLDCSTTKRVPNTERYVFGKLSARCFQRRVCWHRHYSSCGGFDHGKSAPLVQRSVTYIVVYTVGHYYYCCSEKCTFTWIMLLFAPAGISNTAAPLLGGATQRHHDRENNDEAVPSSIMCVPTYYITQQVYTHDITDSCLVCCNLYCDYGTVVVHTVVHCETPTAQ